MITKTCFKILLSFSAAAMVLVVWPGQESYCSPPSASATIAATATVVEPLGLIAQPDLDLHRLFLLYSPHNGRTQCQISYDGQEKLFSLKAPDHSPTSLVPLPLFPTRNSEPNEFVVTITYTEN
ncbi:MAG: hypothetical protein WAU88_02225 [Candidatus Zixiibacteriota bacterium]